MTATTEPALRLRRATTSFLYLFGGPQLYQHSFATRRRLFLDPPPPLRAWHRATQRFRPQSRHCSTAPHRTAALRPLQGKSARLVASRLDRAAPPSFQPLPSTHLQHLLPLLQLRVFAAESSAFNRTSRQWVDFIQGSLISSPPHHHHQTTLSALVFMPLALAPIRDTTSTTTRLLLPSQPTVRPPSAGTNTIFRTTCGSNNSFVYG